MRRSLAARAPTLLVNFNVPMAPFLFFRHGAYLFNKSRLPTLTFLLHWLKRGAAEPATVWSEVTSLR
jgi:hypothetical protein